MSQKHKPDTNNHLSLILIIGVTVVAIFGIFKTNLYQFSPQNKDKTDLPDATEWKRITSVQSLFFTPIYLDRSKTDITIPIKFDDATKISWLTLTSTESGQPSTFLMTHPLLEKIDWPFVKNGHVYLYQRQKDYASIDAFIANPPPRNKVAIDSDLMQFESYKKIPGYPLDEAFDPNYVDYVLTTYARPQKQGDAYIYRNTIDASSGVINENNNLTWQITVPGISSQSAYYLGNIQVEYNQTK